MSATKKILLHRVTHGLMFLLSVSSAFLVVVYLDPDSEMYFPFSSLLFLCGAVFATVFFLVQIIFQRVYVSLLVALFLVCNIVLRYFGFGDYLYTLILFVLFVLLGILIHGDVRPRKKNEKTGRRLTRRRVIRDGAQK